MDTLFQEDNMNSETELMREVQDLMSEFENSRTLIDSLIPVVEELVMSFSAISKLVPVSISCRPLHNTFQIWPFFSYIYGMHAICSLTTHGFISYASKYLILVL